MMAEFTPRTEAEKTMWAYMQKTRSFTHDDLAQATGISDFKRRRFISQLRSKGLLDDCGRRDLKTLMTVMDTEAVQSFAAQQRRTPEGMMWSAIRSLKQFTPTDIAMALTADNFEADLAKIQNYCQILLRAGYLSVLEKARHNVRPARYRLVRDTGPLPVREKMVKATIDPNDERVVRIAGQTL